MEWPSRPCSMSERAPARLRSRSSTSIPGLASPLSIRLVTLWLWLARTSICSEPTAGRVGRAGNRREPSRQGCRPADRPRLRAPEDLARHGGTRPRDRGPVEPVTPANGKVEDAVAALRAGLPVVLPTDTVYGLSAN